MKIPLYGSHKEINGELRKGIAIKASDCPNGVPPSATHNLHVDLNERVDKRYLKNGERVGYIEVEEGTVVDWDINVPLKDE